MSKKDIKSLEERAKNYANEVQQITDFVEQVRQTPDVYIGKIAGNRAFLTMTREIIQNAIDEILKGVAFSNIFLLSKFLFKLFIITTSFPDLESIFNLKLSNVFCSKSTCGSCSIFANFFSMLFALLKNISFLASSPNFLKVFIDSFIFLIIFC